MALSSDPLCWEAYRDLCTLGAAEEASTVFGNANSQCLQKTCVAQRRNFLDGASKDTSLWQTEHIPGENQQDLKIKQLGADFPPCTDRQINSNSHTNGWDLNTPSPVLTQVLDAPPPLLHKNMRRPTVEGSLMSLHGERRRKFVTEEMSAEVVYLQ